VVERGEGGEELLAGLEGVDLCQRRLDRLAAEGVNRGGVHAGGEVVAYLLLDGRAVGGLGVFFQNSPEKLLVVVG